MEPCFIVVYISFLMAHPMGFHKDDALCFVQLDPEDEVWIEEGTFEESHPFALGQIPQQEQFGTGWQGARFAGAVFPQIRDESALAFLQDGRGRGYAFGFYQQRLVQVPIEVDMLQGSQVV